MNRFYWLKISLFFFIGLQSIQAQYSVLDILDSLTDESNTVIRLYKQNVVVHDLNQVEESVEKVITFLNNHSDFSYLHVPYTGKNEPKDIEYVVYDALGQEIEEVKKKEFQDFYSHDGISVLVDDRFKTINVEKYEFPFTVRVKYSMQYDESYMFGFRPIWDEEISVEQAEYSMTIANSNLPLTYKSNRLEGPVIKNTSSGKQYIWTLNNQPQIEDFIFDNFRNELPRLRLHFDSFIRDGYKGDWSSWTGYGDWMYSLQEELTPLEESVLQEIKQVIPEKENKVEQIRAVYDYLQDNSRYVSIQLGIGGLKPFDPNFVHEKKYGDCKALSFYTKSILDSYDINSYYTLIYGGNYPEEVNEEEVFDSFNHVILSVPVETDTLFLECTSQQNPFGYLGDFTSNRNALLVDKNKGELIRTTTYLPEENLFDVTGKIAIKEDGEASFNIQAKFTGISIDDFSLTDVINEDDKGKYRWFNRGFELPNQTIQSLDIQIDESTPAYPEAEVSASGIMPFGKATSSKFYFKTTPVVYIPDINFKEYRKRNIIVRDGYTHQSVITYSLPSGFQLSDDRIPEPVHINNELFSFLYELTRVNEKQCKLNVHFHMNSGEFSYDLIPQLNADFKEMRKTLNRRVLLDLLLNEN